MPNALTADESFPPRSFRVVWWGTLFGGLIATTVAAQGLSPKEGASPAVAPAKEDLSPASAKVDVNPVTRDEDIRRRLENVLEATDWFIAPEVRVEQGVVFFGGAGGVR